MAVAGVYVPLSTRDIQNIKIPTKFTYLQLVHAKAALTVTDHYGRKKVPDRCKISNFSKVPLLEWETSPDSRNRFKVQPIRILNY